MQMDQAAYNLWRANFGRTSSAAQMSFSNNGTSFSTPEPFQTTKSWALSSGTGNKTVYVKFFNALGQELGMFSDAIFFGTGGPTYIPGGTISQNTTWSLAGSPYIVQGNVTVAGTSTTPAVLTIEPGVEVQVDYSFFINIGGSTNLGALVAQGTQQQPILFTSPSGQWAGIRFRNTTVDATSIVEHAIVEFGGDGSVTDSANISLVSANPTIRNVTLRNSSTYGLYVSGSSPTISNAVIQTNNTGECLTGGASPTMTGIQAINNFPFGFYLSGVGGNPNPVVHQSNIYNNGIFDVYTEAFNPGGASVILNFEDNWWGTGNLQLIADRIWDFNDTGTNSEPIIDFEPTRYVVAITDAQATPLLFSPNGDNNQDTTQITADVGVAADWTVEIKDASEQVVRTFSGTGTNISVTWNGRDQSNQLFPDGDYTWTINATDPVTQSQATPVSGTVSVDTVIDLSQITEPLPAANLTGTVAIKGRADDVNFSFWQLSYGQGTNPAQWNFIGFGGPAIGTPPPTLADWNTSQIINGNYILRLQVVDQAGNSSDIRVSVVLYNVTILNSFISPVYFSPNGDSVQDDTTVSAQFNGTFDWTVTFKNASQQTVRTLSGNGSDLSTIWDGKDESQSVVPEGIYSYTIGIFDPATSTSGSPVSGTVTVDLTFPNVDITSPAQSAILFGEDVFVIGTASDANLANYTLVFGEGVSPVSFTGFASGSTSVISNSLGTWEDIYDLENGLYTLRLTANDRAGNTSVLNRQVTLDNIELTNVSRSPAVIDHKNGETTDILFTLDRNAQVTIGILDELTSANVRTLSTGVQSAGSHSVAWDGKNDSNQVLPYEAYYFGITAQDGTGRMDQFVDTFSGSPTPNGAVTIQNENFDPFKNEQLLISYTVPAPGRQPVTIQGGPFGQAIRTLVGNEPKLAGPRTDTWDGRDNNGQIYSGNYSILFDVPISFHSQTIILQDSASNEVSNFNAEAYLVFPIQSEVATLKYSLARESIVTVTITDPNGNHFRTLIQSETQAAGNHEIVWDGTNNDGERGAVEGSYRVEITATDPVSGSIVEKLGSVIIYR
jgi:flagellar hook assembly protein FlgD